MVFFSEHVLNDWVLRCWVKWHYFFILKVRHGFLEDALDSGSVGEVLNDTSCTKCLGHCVCGIVVRWWKICFNPPQVRHTHSSLEHCFSASSPGVRCVSNLVILVFMDHFAWEKVSVENMFQNSCSVYFFGYEKVIVRTRV